MSQVRQIPEGTLKRLNKYLSILRAFNKRNREYITNAHLSSFVDQSIQTIRKDLDHVDSWTSNSEIHNIEYLIKITEAYLGFTNTEEAFLIIENNLHTEDIISIIKEKIKIKIIAVFSENKKDSENYKKDNIKILDLSKLEELSDRMHIKTAVVVAKPNNAQSMVNCLSDYGFLKIYNCSKAQLISSDCIKMLECNQYFENILL
ncbi:MAG: winged-helix domain-containing protein [Bacteroidales bacterium]